MKIVHGGDIYSTNNPNNIIDFSANINPLGMPSTVKKAIVDNIDNYSVYPDPLCRDLRKEIGKFEKVKNDFILCGNGAADIIFRIALYLRPKEALILAPTFSEYEEALNVVNCNISYYNLNEDNNFTIDIDILDHIVKRVDIMFLCNPNNPTGIPLKKEIVLKIAHKCKANNTFLVVDECFVEFLEKEEDYTIKEYINLNDHVIILRAFTKIYAMAGLRLGYILTSNLKVIDGISKVGQPWSVSQVATVAGIAALKEESYVKETKKYIKENREYLKMELKRLGFKVFNSKANYIFFKCKNKGIEKYLRNKDILIRSCSNYVGLNDSYFRIAVKSRNDNIKLIQAIRDFLKENINLN